MDRQRLNEAEHEVAEAIEGAIDTLVSVEEEVLLEAAEIEELEDWKARSSPAHQR